MQCLRGCWPAASRGCDVVVYEGGEDHTATFRAEAGHSYVLDVSRDIIRIRPRFEIEIEDKTARETVFLRRDTPP